MQQLENSRWRAALTTSGSTVPAVALHPLLQALVATIHSDADGCYLFAPACERLEGMDCAAHEHLSNKQHLQCLIGLPAASCERLAQAILFREAIAARLLSGNSKFVVYIARYINQEDSSLSSLIVVFYVVRDHEAPLLDFNVEAYASEAISAVTNLPSSPH
jgi:hypothetical protein